MGINLGLFMRSERENLLPGVIWSFLAWVLRKLVKTIATLCQKPFQLGLPLGSLF